LGLGNVYKLGDVHEQRRGGACRDEHEEDSEAIAMSGEAPISDTVLRLG